MPGGRRGDGLHHPCRRDDHARARPYPVRDVARRSTRAGGRGHRRDRTFSGLERRYPDLPVHGNADDVAIPGLVNAHHHVGLTPFQLGAPDLPLELWAIARMGARAVDPYLDTLYSGFELIASGVTTVQHTQDTVEGSLPAVKARLDAVIRAYRDLGMRASFCYSIADQKFLVQEADETFLGSIPRDLASSVSAMLARIEVGLEGGIELFRSLHSEHANDRRIRVQLAPANLHWCSDKAPAVIAGPQNATT